MRSGRRIPSPGRRRATATCSSRRRTRSRRSTRTAASPPSTTPPRSSPATGAKSWWVNGSPRCCPTTSSPRRSRTSRRRSPARPACSRRVSTARTATSARQHKPERTPTSVNQVLDDTLELRGYELRVRGIDVQRDYDEQSPETMADAHQLQQVFLNLITNAEQAMERAERDQQRLVIRTRRNGDLIRIDVQDTGPGIPPNLLERIFNPFFTTKPTGSGTGLGLSISLGIVREHEGRIFLASTGRPCAPKPVEFSAFDQVLPARRAS